MYNILIVNKRSNFMSYIKGDKKALINGYRMNGGYKIDK